MTPEKESDLIAHLEILLKEAAPKIESRSNQDGIAVTLNFNEGTISRQSMRQLARMLADAAV